MYLEGSKFIRTLKLFIFSSIVRYLLCINNESCQTIILPQMLKILKRLTFLSVSSLLLKGISLQKGLLEILLF